MDDPDSGNILDPLTLHKYIYAMNNPVNRIDPSGRGFLEDIDLEEVTFETYIKIYRGAKVAKEVAAVFCLEAAALYAVQNPLAPLWEIDIAERYCLSTLKTP